MSKRSRESLIQAVRSFDAAAIQQWLEEEERDPKRRRVLRDLIQLYQSDVPVSIYSLPNELLTHILVQLDPATLIIMRRVCKLFYRLIWEIALRTQEVTLPAMHWLLVHYPCVEKLHVPIYRSRPMEPAFLQQLAACTKLRELHFQLPQLRIVKYTSLPKEMIQRLRFNFVTSLHLSFSLHNCFCFLFRGIRMTAGLSLHTYFPSLQEFYLNDFGTSSHVARCKLLTLTKRSMTRLSLFQLGLPTEDCVSGDSSWYEPTLQRLFDKLPMKLRTKESKLHTLRCFFPDHGLLLLGGMRLNVLAETRLPERLYQLNSLELVTSRFSLFRVTSQGDYCMGMLLRKLLLLPGLNHMVTHVTLGYCDALSVSIPALSSFLQTLPHWFTSSWKLILYNYKAEHHSWISAALSSSSIAWELYQES